MLSSEHFYNQFQINHFDYKQEANRFLLQMDDETFESTFKEIFDYNKKDFQRTVKMDIRFTFLLAAETLFEFIFALLPSENGKLNDKYLLQRLAEKRYNNKEIRKFAKGEENLLDSIFKENVYYSNKTEATFLQHLFYPGVNQEEIKFSISDSLEIVYESLRTLALELSDRTELNSFKHGLKGIPFFQSFAMHHPETQKTLYEVDVSDSITNYVWDQKENKSHFETKTFDWKRDIGLTNWTSNLLNNIIECRKSMFESGKDKTVSVIFYNRESWVKAHKVNVKAQRFKLTLEHE